MTEGTNHPVSIQCITHKGEILLVFNQALTMVGFNATDARAIAQQLIAFADAEEGGKGRTKQ